MFKKKILADIEAPSIDYSFRVFPGSNNVTQVNMRIKKGVFFLPVKK